LALGLFRGDVAEGGMKSLAIVVGFDVGKQVASGLVAGGDAVPMDLLDLHGVEEALQRCMIVAASGSAHGRYGTELFE
jgi:hypothetical protein